MKIIITGLPGSGKTTLAGHLSETGKYKVVNLDQFRYYPGTWDRRGHDEFRQCVLAEVQDNTIFEGAFYDTSDPTNSRVKVMLELFGHADIICFIDIDQHTQAEQLINRSINRAIGKEDNGNTTETSANRAGLLIKNITGFELNRSNLETAKLFASINLHCHVISGTFDQVKDNIMAFIEGYRKYIK